MENNFGAFLKQKRLEKSLTQKQLADILFVSESAISKWEKNVALPDITLLPTLSKTLGVSEHELITASIDEDTRKEKAQAKKWRTLAFTWSLFFYISYLVALIPCFITNLAIDKKLSWFWIVFSALLLAFTFTNLPKLIKKHKLLLIPLSNFLALCLLLGVVCLFSGGKWFLIATTSVLLSLVIVFLPIFISKYKIFYKIRNFNDFICIAVDFILINTLLIIIDNYCVNNGFSLTHWFLPYAMPICTLVYLAVNLLICVKFLKLNRFFKTSIILSIITFLIYLPPLFIKVSNHLIQQEINDINIFKANLSSWNIGNIENNVHLIIFLTLLALSLTFLLVGFFIKKRKQ